VQGSVRLGLERVSLKGREEKLGKVGLGCLIKGWAISFFFFFFLFPHQSTTPFWIRIDV